MGLQVGPYAQIPPQTQVISSLTYTDQVLDAADEAHAWIVRVPKTCNIRKVAFRTSTVTTGATVDVRIETVSLTDGYPTGTLKSTNSNASLVIADTDDNKVLISTLTADAGCTVGDYIGIIVKNPSSSFGNFQIRMSYGDLTTELPYMSLYTGGAWGSKTAGVPVLYLELDDGSRLDIGGMTPFSVYAGTTFNNTSTTRERALYFQLPYPIELIACGAFIDEDGDHDFILYDSDGSTPLVTISRDKDVRRTTSAGHLLYYFSAGVQLLKDTWYRASIKPTTSTSINLAEALYLTSAELARSEAGPNFRLSTKDSGGTWSQADPNDRTRPSIYLIGRAFHDGVGGGLLTHPGMAGGLRG